MKISVVVYIAIAVLSVQVAGKGMLRSSGRRRTWSLDITKIQLTPPAPTSKPTPRPSPKPTQHPTPKPTPMPTVEPECDLVRLPAIRTTDDLVNKIYDIQWTELTSPFVGQTVYNVPGIVTAVNGNRYFLQDQLGDGDILTSDGIEVFTGNEAPTVKVGDVIKIKTALVQEYVPPPPVDPVLEPMFMPLRQPVTRLVDAVLDDGISGGNALPDPIVIGVGGRFDSEDDSFGRVPPTDSMEAAVDFFESLEGMFVKMVAPIAVSRSGENEAIFVVGDEGQYASGFNNRGNLNVGPNDFSPEAIQIMEDEGVFPLHFPQTNVGTQFDDIEGVIGYSNGKYVIIPNEHFGIVQASSLQKKRFTCEKKFYVMSVGTYNIQASKNYADLAADIVTYMGLPDVLALQSAPTDYNFTALVSAIEGVVSDEPNTYTVIDSIDGTPILINPWRVTQYANNTSEKGDTAGDVPKHLAVKLKFLPLQLKFDLINVQLTNKDGSVAVQGVNQPFEALQEANDINGGVEKRLKETTVVRNLIEGDSKFVTNSSRVIVLGAMYENEFVTPIENLERTPLKNLIDVIPFDLRYSVIDQGASQAWDHIFVSEYFCSGATADYAHVNSEFFNETRFDPMVTCLELPFEE